MRLCRYELSYQPPEMAWRAVQCKTELFERLVAQAEKHPGAWVEAMVPFFDAYK